MLTGWLIDPQPGLATAGQGIVGFALGVPVRLAKAHRATRADAGLPVPRVSDRRS